MSDVLSKSCNAHVFTKMKVLIFLLILSVYDTYEQALPDDNNDYAGDYAGKDDTVDKPKDDVDTPDVASMSKSVESSQSRSLHRHHHSKRHKYWKATIEFLKKTLNPNTLMQNAWFTEMLRKFSNSEDHHEEEVESEESEEVIHTIPPTKRRRGRPPKNRRYNAASLEITGLRKGLRIFSKGLKKISTIDKKKLRRNIKMMKRMARKAKKPLKSVVKFYLSSKNVNNNGFGNNNYGNNY